MNEPQLERSAAHYLARHVVWYVNVLCDELSDPSTRLTVTQLGPVLDTLATATEALSTVIGLVGQQINANNKEAALVTINNDYQEVDSYWWSKEWQELHPDAPLVAWVTSPTDTTAYNPKGAAA